MKANNIGESDFGSIMDAAAKGKEIMAHRLYGHHLIYDFPEELKNVPDFLEHEFSDLFTNMGLPILSGELLENTALYQKCVGLTDNWNFVNGFDILAGTVAIYTGLINTKAALTGNFTVDDFNDLAKSIGIGTIELAIAMSACNPFLLVGGLLHISSGLIGICKDGESIMLVKVGQRYQVKQLTRKYLIDYPDVETILNQKYDIESIFNCYDLRFLI